MFTLKEILQYQKENDLSDVHLISGLSPMARNHHGEIKAFSDDVLTKELISEFIKEICSEKEINELKEMGNLDKADTFFDVARFRVNVFTERRGHGINFRIIPNELTKIDDLDIPSEIRTHVLGRSGLVIVSGPNNSGKTTILNSFVELINEVKKVKIITFEDPIEYIHEMKKSLISQHQISVEHKSRLKNDLKSVFRQDVNVVCIGEIRDTEMMNIALEMAETGYLVMGTMHATDTIQTLERIANMFDSSNRQQLFQQLSIQLKSIICQHLVPGIKESLIPCREVLISTDAVRNVIANGDLSDLARPLETDSINGNTCFDQYLVDLFQKKQIEQSTVYEYCHNRSFVNQIMK